ncbi:hypothetical protein K0M31_014009 [Melipona bicolor]|uniref:Uncharacterized protein n=1 Tax=Melipona bicolor TaxID=60889 RepID=A0AA40G7N8_9HYME|nr:hypothetical protein K0M31_014009 [Melipona bicolor]
MDTSKSTKPVPIGTDVLRVATLHQQHHQAVCVIPQMAILCPEEEEGCSRRKNEKAGATEPSRTTLARAYVLTRKSDVAQ